MQDGSNYLVAAYAIIWVALLVYLGWMALRLRGVRTEIETVRALVEAREEQAERE